MSSGAAEIRRRRVGGTAVHEDVVFAARIADGAVLHGRGSVVALFYDDIFSWPIYEPEARRVEPLSSTFALVTGVFAT